MLQASTNELIELTEDELDLVGGGYDRRGSSVKVHVKIELNGNGDHDGNGNTVDIGNGNGVFISL